MNRGPDPAQNYPHAELPILWVVPLFPGGGINSSASLLQSTCHGQISKQFIPSERTATRYRLSGLFWSIATQLHCFICWKGDFSLQPWLPCRVLMSYSIDPEARASSRSVSEHRWGMAGLCSGVFLLSGLLDIDKKSFSVANYSRGSSSLIFLFLIRISCLTVQCFNRCI